MSNPYFDSYSPLPRFQNARAEAVNAIIDAIIVGFDLVPDALSIANAAAIAAGVLATVAQWSVGAGLVNATTGAYPTPVTTLTDGLLLGFRANLTNTSSTPTFKPDAMTARTITRNGGQALNAGDIQINGEYLLRYNLANTRWELMNPSTPSSATVTIASAATTDLSASAAPRQTISGSVGITSFGTGAGLTRRVIFTGNPLITYNASSLITPTAANIQAAAGDIAWLESDAAGNWTITNYLRGVAPVTANVSATTLTGAYVQKATWNLSAGKWRISATFYENANNGPGYDGVAISTTTASAAGCTAGKDLSQFVVETGGHGGGAIAPFEVTLTTTTAYFLNALMSGVTTPAFSAHVRCEPII